MGRAARSVRSSEDATRLEQLHAWCQGAQAGAPGLEALARRVLKAALGPYRAREAEAGDVRRPAADSPRRPTLAFSAPPPGSKVTRTGS